MPLQRYYSHYKHRPASYWTPKGGLWSELSGLHTLDNSGIQAGISTCDTPVLYVLPSEHNKYPTYADYVNIAGYNVKKCLYKDGRRPVVATLQCEDKVTTVYPISLWYDVTFDTRLKDVIKGHSILQKILEANFQPAKVYAGTAGKFSVEILATPGQLGSDLLKRSLPYNQEYAQLPQDIANIILDTTTQGRIQTFYHGQDTIENLHYHDGRWMYAACLRHTPTGRIQRDTIPEIALTPPKLKKDGSPAQQALIPGYYRVKVTIPREWSHIGLLPLVQHNKVDYPQQAGRTFETWITSIELGLALKHSWQVQILERILWPDTYIQPEPLKVWGERLVKIRMELAKDYPEPYKGMIEAASRNILLQTVGTFFRSAKERDYYTDNPDSIPEEATSELLLENGTWKYTLPEKLSPLQLALCQPHWPLFIWSLARRKLVEYALQVPYKQLIALRVDGVWANCPMPAEDTGKIGQFREKRVSQTNGLKWPVNTKEMVRLVQEVRA